MAQEEHTPRCSNSSAGAGGGCCGGACCGDGGRGSGGGGVGTHRSSKKLKHKKVPQRGMGVAQLEKIISEARQKKDVAILTPNSIISPSNSSSCLATVQTDSNFQPPIPLPPPLPPNHHPLLSKTDAINPSSVSVRSAKPATISGGGGGNNRCRLGRDREMSFEVENQKHGLDTHGPTTAFPLNIGGSPYESSPSVWSSLPNGMQRSHHFQQPCSSSMMNVSAGTSSLTSSSVSELQMEPPSNQSHSGNNYQTLWPEEEKIVGIKRSNPFSLENIPIPSFHCKFPWHVSPISRVDESASCTDGGFTNIKPLNPVFRENPSISSAISDTVTKKYVDENQDPTRDFLTLAPPKASRLHSGSKEKLHPSPSIGELPQFGTLAPHYGQTKDQIHLSRRGGSNQQPFLSFFPAARTSLGQAGNSNGDAGETVDLNLKL